MDHAVRAFNHLFWDLQLAFTTIESQNTLFVFWRLIRGVNARQPSKLNEHLFWDLQLAFTTIESQNTLFVF